MKAELLQIFGDDNMVVDAARVSFGKESANYSEENNARLIKYLAQHNHTSPFRHPQIQYRITCPIFVERQLFKHQVGLTANSISGRYVDFEDNYYMIDNFRIQSKTSKQGSDGNLELNINDKAEIIMHQIINANKKAYKDLLDLGVAKEQARAVLPLCLETTFIWTGSLLAYINLFKLRITRDTQVETMKLCMDMLHELKLSNKFVQSLEAFHL
jgi:thymidylate synthase (FAD)